MYTSNTINNNNNDNVNSSNTFINNLNRLLPNSAEKYYGIAFNTLTPEFKKIISGKTNNKYFSILSPTDPKYNGLAFLSTPDDNIPKIVLFKKIFNNNIYQSSSSSENNTEFENEHVANLTRDQVNNYYHNILSRKKFHYPGRLILSVNGDCRPTLLKYLRDNIQDRLVLGMMAWFTDSDIIDILCEKSKRMNFIVNNENYGIEGDNVFGSKTNATIIKYNQCQQALAKAGKLPALEQHYGHINCHLSYRDRLDDNGQLVVWDPPLKYSKTEWVRAFGNDPSLIKNDSKQSSYKTKKKQKLFQNYMHIKAIIICNENDIPYRVIIGSYNYTKNAQNNIESFNIVEGYDVAAYYFEMFNKLMTVSQPLYGVREYYNNTNVNKN